VRDAFENAGKAAKRDGRKATRYKITSVIWLELETGTLPAVAVNLSEHGMAIRTTEPLRLQSGISFRCSLPGTDQLHGQADVIWSDADGHAGMFFSRMSLSAQKHLRDWLRQREKMAPGNERGRSANHRKMAGKGMTGKTNGTATSIRALLRPGDSHVRMAAK
jgi:hypothetical protein